MKGFAMILVALILSGSFIALMGTESADASGLADSPWPMFRGNAQHTGLSEYDTSGNDGALLWKYEIGRPASGGMVKTSPVVDGNGNIYVGVGKYMYSISSNGTLRWKFAVKGDIESSTAIGSDGTIYFGSKDGFLYALNPEGELRWKFNATTWVVSSPAIDDDGDIYFGSYDHHLYVLHPNGTLKWSFNAGDMIATSPAIYDGTVYFTTDFTREIYALHTNNGTMRWKDSIDYYFSSRGPAIGPDGHVYVCDSEDMVHLWSEDGSDASTLGVGGDVAIGKDGTLYAGTDRFYAMNPDGSHKWTFEIPTNPDGINMNSVPSIGADGTIYFGVSTGNLYALNPDGSLKWKYALNSSISVGPAIGKNGTIYALAQGGTLYAIGGSSHSSGGSSGGNGSEAGGSEDTGGNSGNENNPENNGKGTPGFTAAMLTISMMASAGIVHLRRKC